MPRTGTSFGGVAGSMLSRTASVGSVFTGLFFLLAIGALTLLPERTGTDIARLLLAQFLISFFLAHFAVEGYSEAWERGGRPIPSTQAGSVALRYMIMAALVLAPLFAIARSREAVTAMVLQPQASAVLLIVYALALLASPPMLLVVSVSADAWGDLFSPAHWRARFRGRAGDLFLIYTIFLGAIFLVLFASLPLVGFAATRGTRAMNITGAAVGTFAIGFAISLLGRLCGSFAAPRPPEVIETKTAVLHPALSQFDKPAATAQPGLNGTAPAASAPRKAPLPEAGGRVEELRAKHGANPEALVAGLRELDETFLPNPSVRQALCLALIAAGRQQESMTLAREAIPFCVKSGSPSAAALIYEALVSSGESFGVTKDQVVSFADLLRSMKRPGGALKVYTSVLRSNPGDPKAMKGMIAVAGELSQHKETAPESMRVYDYLIQNCAASPLVDFVKAERDKLERRAQRPSAP